MPLPRVDIPEILGEGCGDITALEQVLGRPGDRVVSDAGGSGLGDFPHATARGASGSHPLLVARTRAGPFGTRFAPVATTVAPETTQAASQMENGLMKGVELR